MSDDDEPEEEEGGGPAWLVSFADLMSLMLVFFVLLFSMSTVEEVKARLIIGSLQSTFRIDGPRMESRPEVTQTVQISRPARDFQNRLVKLFERNFPIEKSHEIDLGRQMRVIIQANDLFQEGTSIIREDKQAFVEELANSLTDIGATDRPQMFAYFDSPVDVIEQTSVQKSIDVERGSVLADTLVARNVPQQFISVGAFPLGQPQIEFYFYLYENPDVAQTFEWLIWE